MPAAQVTPQAPRYSDCDLEPLRAALLALSHGDYAQPVPGAAHVQADGALGQVWPLVNAVAAELATLNAEVARRAEQVRDIATAVAAVARGDLTRKVTADVQGEMLQLKQTVNTMVDQLSAFADEVTRVAVEVGTEGRLGGQAYVRGVSGVWKDLTDSVNGLASNLTTQVRAIAGVASAVAEGDLTQSITVGARGEVAELKDNINLMVANLRETTRANREQDWLNTNLARLSSLMQGHRDPHEVARLIMSELTPLVSAQYGAFYLATAAGLAKNGTGQDAAPGGAPGPGADDFTRIAAYGFHRSGMTSFAFGEGLAGQAALDRTRILVENAPPGYVTVGSGLGESASAHLAVLPILFEDQVLGVLELASLHTFSDLHLAFFDRFVPTIGVTINAIMANSRTEVLLTESQRLATQLQERSDELQRQQAELRRSNAELEDKAALLAKQNRAIEVQNFQIDQARRTLEERAQQLAISSQYKSEFLANMSHELRTPLNSLLVLAKLLAENPDGNLTVKQVEFARTIHEAGSDLLQLINDILDLSKVEAGKMEIHPAAISVEELLDYVEATFRPTAAQKGLKFRVTVDEDVPPLIYSDEQRLQQILRNLISNAVKFTHSGGVTLRVSWASSVTRFTGPLRGEKAVLAFSVSDTGIGIVEGKLELIFGAFQQADGTTSRGYGGTGLGLSISRDIARLLGGEIHAASQLGLGSTFTFYLPNRRDAAITGRSSGPGGDWASGPEPGEPGTVSRGADWRHAATDPFALPGAWTPGGSAGALPAARAGGPGGGTAPALAGFALSPPPSSGRPAAAWSEPASSAPGSSAPALSAPALSAPGLSAPGLSAPGLSAPGLSGSGSAGSGSSGPGSAASGSARPGSAASGLSASGLSRSGLPRSSSAASPVALPPAADDPLNGAKILIVDDDARNAFALTSVFEQYGAGVRYAENGRAGIEILDREPDVALVLMDVMMPELDGYATTAAIRRRAQFADLPIVMVTAKAMKGDRAKAIASGASEYVTKPVDIEHLLGLMRGWLVRRVPGDR